MQKELTGRDIASKALSEALASLDGNSQPIAVRECVQAFASGVNDAIGVSAQLDADRAELTAKADLLPAAGAARLAREAQAEAEARGSEALDKARRSTEIIRRAALLGAQPSIDPARESLGREELSMVLGSGTPDQLALAVAKIAEHGSRDALACLHSDYGRALCQSRGLEGRDLDAALASAKRVVVESALDNPHRHTAGELKNAKLWLAAGECDAAIGAASFALGSQGVTA